MKDLKCSEWPTCSTWQIKEGAWNSENIGPETESREVDRTEEGD